MNNDDVMNDGSAAPNMVQRPFQNMVAPVATQEMLEKSAARRAIKSNILSKNRRDIPQRYKVLNAHRKAMRILDPIAEVKRRGITHYRIPNIPVQQVRQSRRVRQQPKRLANEMHANKNKKGTKKAKAKGVNHTKRFNKKAPKIVRTNNLGNPIKRAVKKTPRKAPKANEENDRNPYAVRLGAIKRKYEAMIASKEAERGQALEVRDYRSAAIIKKEIEALEFQKKAEQNAARKGIVEEGQRIDNLADIFGQAARLNEPVHALPVHALPVPAPPAPYPASTSAPAGFVMRPATGGPGWAYPTGGPGGPPPDWGGEGSY